MSKQLKRERPLPQIALRWLELGPKAFMDEQLETARTEQRGIKGRIRSSIENYFRIERLHKSA